VNWIYTEYLFDAIEKTTYGTYWQNATEEGKKYWEIHPFDCKMKNDICTTDKAFQDFVKIYMEN
jgi:hypothetical protein